MLTVTERKISTLTDCWCCPHLVTCQGEGQGMVLPLEKQHCPIVAQLLPLMQVSFYCFKHQALLGRSYPQQVIANCRQAPGLQQTHCPVQQIRITPTKSTSSRLQYSFHTTASADPPYLGRLGGWGLGLLGNKGFDSVRVTPWEFWCSSWEVLVGEGCGSLRGGICWWWSECRRSSFSLVLLLCSANNTSNRFLRPCTALRWVKECVCRTRNKSLIPAYDICGSQTTKTRV